MDADKDHPLCRDVCHYCGASPDQMVNNGKRERWFQDVDGDLVVVRKGTVTKWKCRVCKKTFTQCLAKLPEQQGRTRP